ncbi:NUDIX hydrolase [Patulibacter medicamentivorans]|jgi:8-oxo-dGTP diphosphatase|uniref:NUDIX hydrolase n=1 Tax=Patulibacter medicamentivorans TaxID=1097667 RepID=H0E3C1_9ACTN|nr:NUDIX hydrolase [Patulibacter medicamentivorans]EHN11830.1 NUDIX hydrolase [Patulibacter medicamentivorans]
MFPREVQAAGGVLVRDGLTAVVHRPYRDDWSLPKGKLDPGETFLQAALREVVEETGLRCTAGEELPEVHYQDQKGRPKVVRYWLMTVDGGTFAANDEVDELRWLSFDDAAALLTYEADRQLLRAAQELLAAA